MRALRVIYRIDFPRNYDMMNRPGAVARILNESFPPEFFDKHGEDRNARKVIGKRLLRDQARYRSLTAEPTAIVCDIERAAGIELRSLAEDEDFRTICGGITDFLKEFGIKKFERAGFRLFLFGSVLGDRQRSLRAFRSLVKSDMVKGVESIVGNATDLGIAIDGISASKVSYHLRCGPFVGTEEYGKYFSAISDLLPKDLEADFVTDLDFFENKFAYTASSAVKWCVPQIETAGQLVQLMAKTLAEEAQK